MAEPEETITLVDEEGVEHDFTLINVIEVDGCEYAILLPVDDEDDEAIVLRFTQDEEGNDILMDIEDDEEWEKVVDTWEEMISK